MNVNAAVLLIRHRGELGPGILRRLIKDAGLTVDKFVGLLRK